VLRNNLGGSEAMSTEVYERISIEARDGIPQEAKSQLGAPGTIRTSDPQIRSLVLYPAELRARFRFSSRA
jgi:hypothetical protein